MGGLTTEAQAHCRYKGRFANRPYGEKDPFTQGA